MSWKTFVSMPKIEKNQTATPLQRLFTKQQPKVAAKKKVGKLLTTMAEEDHKRIAILLQKWLDESE
ncbi:hypothetical protein QX776_12850 [Alteromonadaceae bacterium BrNp21-10]|nr:hypothetical protein [Alteromonadaceae bacterium BrNp21-10]